MNEKVYDFLMCAMCFAIAFVVYSIAFFIRKRRINRDYSRAEGLVQRAGADNRALTEEERRAGELIQGAGENNKRAGELITDQAEDNRRAAENNNRIRELISRAETILGEGTD